MGGGSTVRAGVGGAQGGLPLAAGAAVAAARHGKPPPRVVSASASAGSSGHPPSCPALRAERSGVVWQPPHPCFCDEDWVERFVFGAAPSGEEVADAVSTIQQCVTGCRTLFPFTSPENAQGHLSSIAEEGAEDGTNVTDSMNIVPSSETKSDWLWPAWQVHGGNTIQQQACNKGIDDFRLLQINPAVQRTVFSISSDKAVWDAVLKNEVVKELRESIFPAGNAKSPSSGDGDGVLARLLEWIIERAKAKVVELAKKIAKTVNELLWFHEKDRLGEMDLSEDALRSSFMLSIVVFILVIITRFQKTLRV